MKAAAPQAKAFLATAQGKRRATQLITTNSEHIPADLLAHQMLGIASCSEAVPLIENALHEGWTLDAEKITCPVRSCGAPPTSSCPGRGLLRATGGS